MVVVEGQEMSEGGQVELPTWNAEMWGSVCDERAVESGHELWSVGFGWRVCVMHSLSVSRLTKVQEEERRSRGAREIKTGDFSQAEQVLTRPSDATPKRGRYIEVLQGAVPQVGLLQSRRLFSLLASFRSARHSTFLSHPQVLVDHREVRVGVVVVLRESVVECCCQTTDWERCTGRLGGCDGQVEVCENLGMSNSM